MPGKRCFPILNETLSGQQNMFKPARSSPQEYLQGRVKGITDQIKYSVRINTCFVFWMGGTGGSSGAWGFIFCLIYKQDAPAGAEHIQQSNLMNDAGKEVRRSKCTSIHYSISISDRKDSKSSDVFCNKYKKPRTLLM